MSLEEIPPNTPHRRSKIPRMDPPDKDDMVSLVEYLTKHDTFCQVIVSKQASNEITSNAKDIVNYMMIKTQTATTKTSHSQGGSLHNQEGE